MGAVQAVSLRRRGRSGAVRLLLHGTLVGSFIPLLLGLIGSSALAPGGLVRSIQDTLPLAARSTGGFDWLPARNPARTALPRDPSPPLPPPFRSIVPSLPSLPAPAPAPRTLPTWVQTHREASLFAGPNEDAPRFNVLPAWSYLKVLDATPGWLLVRYEGDGRRQAGQAWVSAETVGPIGTPRWLANLRETPLFAGPEPDAPTYTRLPAWSILEALGQDEGDRTLVNYAGDGQTRQPGQAWARLNDLDVARAPRDSRLPWGATPGAPQDGVTLAVPYRTQLDGSAYAGTDCGPTSLGMALQAFGISVPTGTLRDQANRISGAWDPNEGVLLDVLAMVAQRYDARALEVDEPNGRRHRWTLEDVRRHLRAGHPVIPQLRYRRLPGREGFPLGYDHFVVLTGFDGDTFYYNDPIPSAGRGRDLAMSASTLLRAWESSDEPMAALAIVR